MAETRGKVILHVDNVEDDLLLSRFAFEKAGVRTPVKEVDDGQEAVDYLMGLGKYGDRGRYPLPCMIITALRMPRLDGFGLLEWLNEREEYRAVPRLVLTGSGLPNDQKRAEDLGCSEYFRKPFEVDALVEVVRVMEREWISGHCPKPPSAG